MKNILSLIFLLSSQIFAQKLPSIADKTKEMERMAGFLNFYWDAGNGKIYLEVKDLKKELLYVNSLPAGLGSNDIGLDRGQLGEERVVFFDKVGKKMMLVQPNYHYRALSNDANEKRAVHDSFAQSTLWGFEVIAEENGIYLVDATDFLLRDAHNVVSRLENMKQGKYQLNPSRSAIYLERTKNFPMNSEFESSITFIGSDAGKYVQAVAPSAEAITLRMHHSFVQLPDNKYVTRVFDPRSSYYPISYYDYSSPVNEPIEKYLTCRHRLQKKDPSAKMSEAVKPIVYYLDNGTPEPIRSALLEGASWWNQAFEAAGYKNAFQIKILPDDADPMDLRYNVINWVHRSTRGWSYGSTVTDPRTGEILKGHVSLGSLRVRQDYLIATGLLSPFENGEPLPKDDKMLKMALARLRQLSAHEVGHTLGLQHNYAASTNSLASVMDYPHPKMTINDKGEIDLSDAYADGIGDWDKVSITWGYQDFSKNIDEKSALNKIIDESIKNKMLYLTDQDARPASSSSATAHLWDTGNDPIADLNNTMKVRDLALSKFGLNTLPKGSPMAFLEDYLVPIYNLQRYQVEAVGKIVGSKNYTFAINGDKQKSNEIVAANIQKNALMAVLNTLKPSKLALPTRIIDLIPPRPSGYSDSRELFRKRTGLAFDPLAAAESLTDFSLSFLFNAERANRIVQNDALDQNITLNDVYETILNETFLAERAKGFEAKIQNQTEQIVLTQLMALSQHDNANYAVKAIVNKVMKELKLKLENFQKSTKNVDYQAHLELALDRMKSPEKAKAYQHKEMAPGAPIGCEE